MSEVNHGDQSTDDDQVETKANPNLVGSAGPVRAHVSGRFQRSQEHPAADADWSDHFNDAR